MGTLIFVEKLARHGAHASRQRFDLAPGQELWVGRGYDCDVALDDAYVAPRHLRLFRDEQGLLWAEDNGSRNGLFVGNGKHREARVQVGAQSLLRIGHSRLLVHDGVPDVPPERLDPRSGHGASRALLLCALMLLLGLGQEWLGRYGETRFAEVFSSAVGMLLVVMLWSGGWALLSRLFAGQLLFLRHLAIAAGGVAAMTLLTALLAHLAYALSWSGMLRWDFVLAWSAFAAVCYLHLRAIGPSHGQAKAVAVALLALVAVTVQGLDHFSAPDGRREPDRVAELKPAFLRLREPRPVDQFLADTAALRAALDSDRKDMPAHAPDDDNDEP